MTVKTVANTFTILVSELARYTRNNYTHSNWILEGAPPALHPSIGWGGPGMKRSRANVSGKYLDHLEKLKNLHEAVVLTSEEFEEQKSLLCETFVN